MIRPTHYNVGIIIGEKPIDSLKVVVLEGVDPFSVVWLGCCVRSAIRTPVLVWHLIL